MTRPYDPCAPRTAPFFWKAHQTAWVSAANSLPFQARMAAYGDICSLTGASWNQVVEKAKRVRSVDKLKASEPRRIMVVGCKPGPRKIATGIAAE